MRTCYFLLLAVLCASFVLPAAAQQPSTSALQVPHQDSQAVSVLAQSLVAMGSLAAPNRMTLAQGTISYPDGSTTSITMETIGTDRVRHDVGINDFTFVSHAGDGFLITKGKKVKLKSWITAYKRPEHLPALSLMSDFQNPHFQIKYVGLESITGNLAHHLRLSMLPADDTPVLFEDLMSEFHVWIDQKSLLVLKSRHFDFSPEAIQNRTPVDILYSDYRLQDGAMVPFHLVRFIAGEQQCEIVFSAISLNASVSNSHFQ